MNSRIVLTIASFLVPLGTGAVSALAWGILEAGRFDLGIAGFGALASAFVFPAIIVNRIAEFNGVRRRNQMLFFALATLFVSLYFCLALFGGGDETGKDFVAHIVAFFSIASLVSGIWLWTISGASFSNY